MRPAPHIVAFDIGEVLIDESRVWREWAAIVGVSPATLAAVLGAAIVQGEDHEAALDHVAPNVTWRELEDEHESRYGGFRVDDLYPDVVGCLADLTAAGFEVVLAGNQPARRRAQLEALPGIAPPASRVIVSDELGVAKPDPAFFTALLDTLGCSPGELLYVGDRVDNDVLPAHALGIATCRLERGPWGRLQEVPEDIEVDLALEGLGELAVLLTAWRDEATAEASAAEASAADGDRTDDADDADDADDERGAG